MWFPLEVFLYSTPELLEPALQPRSRMVATTERDSSSNNCTLVVNASLKLLLLLRLLQHLNFIVVPPSRPLYPNGVVMAVLAIWSAAIGIWWYPRTKSTTEKTVAPEATAENEWICGRGYLSSLVTEFSRR